ncbi:MAG TPA: hypothetical protein VK961_06805 [Chthoniobacter sp.]|nr:hypothetical protein [Chthoniobacter sp.]
MKILVILCLATLLAACKERVPKVAIATPPPKSPIEILQQGYKSKAQALKAELEERLKDDTQQDRLMAQYVDLLESERRWLAATNSPDKDIPTARPRLRLDTVTGGTPELLEEKADLLAPFKSTVRIVFNVDPKAPAYFQTSRPLVVNIPVVADPECRWKFPTVEQVLGQVEQLFAKDRAWRDETHRKIGDSILESKLRQ